MFRIKNITVRVQPCQRGENDGIGLKSTPQERRCKLKLLDEDARKNLHPKD